MKYYYLIASLPSLSPKMDASNLDFDELYDVIQRNLTQEDKHYLKYLTYPNDLDNLLTVLSEEYHDQSLKHFKKPGFYSFDELRSYKKNRRNFPDFINDFLADNDDRLANMSQREMEDAMRNRFYDEVFELKNDFLKSYFSFLKNLRSLIGAYNYNSFDFLSKPNINQKDRLLSQVGPGRSPSASLLRDHPFLEDLVSVLSRDEPMEKEQFIDQLQWDFLDEMNREQFNREAVYVYYIKLQILQRWLIIDTETEKEEFEALLEKMIHREPSTKTSEL